MSRDTLDLTVTAMVLAVLVLGGVMMASLLKGGFTDPPATHRADPSSSSRTESSASASHRPIESELRLLTWRDSSTLIVGYKGAIHLYDVNAQTLVRRIVDHYHPVDWRGGDNCFQSAGGRFFLREPHDVMTKVSSEKGPEKPLSRLIPDWRRPDRYIDSHEDISAWDTNPLDCRPIDYQLRQKRAKALTQHQRIIQSSRALLMSKDGDAIYTIAKDRRHPESRRLSFYRETSIRPYRELSLTTPEQSELSAMTNVFSFRDPDGSTVIYESNTDFDSSRGSWPLSAWRLSPDLLTYRMIQLPVGPWVERHGLLKKWSCFSCGCSCYSHFSLMGAQGHLYAHINGKAVDHRSAGIFSLDQTSGRPSWKRIIRGNFAGPVRLSPDGCKMAYLDPEKRLKVTSTKTCLN